MSPQARRVVALVTFVVLLVPFRAVIASSAATAEVSSTSLVGRERSRAGLPSYAGASDLVTVARRQAESMGRQNRLHHNPALGSDVDNWDSVGENVGKGASVEDIHEAFMESDTHRREILSTNFIEVGVGVFERDGVVWVSQVFRKPSPAPAPPDEPAGAPAPATRTGQAENPARPAPAKPAGRAVPTPAGPGGRQARSGPGPNQAPSLRPEPGVDVDLEGLAGAFAAASDSTDSRTAGPTINARPVATVPVSAVGPAGEAGRRVGAPVALAATVLLFVVAGLGIQVAIQLSAWQQMMSRRLARLGRHRRARQPEPALLPPSPVQRPTPEPGPARRRPQASAPVAVAASLVLLGAIGVAAHGRSGRRRSR